MKICQYCARAFDPKETSSPFRFCSTLCSNSLNEHGLREDRKKKETTALEVVSSKEVYSGPSLNAPWEAVSPAEELLITYKTAQRAASKVYKRS